MKHVIRSPWIMIVCLFLVCGLSALAWTVPSSAEKSAIPSEDKTSSPEPASVVSPASRPLPDLTVERLWLDNECRINFQLKNAGPGNIPDAEYSRAQLKLFIGNTEKNFSLSRGTGENPAVDPASVLKKARSTVSFNSGQRLQTSSLVRVWVNSAGQIKEAKTKNNTSQETLKPNCRSVQMPAATAKSKVPPTPP